MHSIVPVVAGALQRWACDQINWSRFINYRIEVCWEVYWIVGHLLCDSFGVEPIFPKSLLERSYSRQNFLPPKMKKKGSPEKRQYSSCGISEQTKTVMAQMVQGLLDEGVKWGTIESAAENMEYPFKKCTMQLHLARLREDEFLFVETKASGHPELHPLACCGRVDFDNELWGL
jgi:hypothetical protein